MTRFILTPACALGGLALLSGYGLARANPAPNRAPAVQAVVDCRQIEDAASRLTCYDRSVDAMAQAETSGDLVTIDREQRQVLRRQAFGFNLPSLGLLGMDKKGGEDDRLTAKVDSVSQDTNGRWVIRLQDGAIWVQTDDSILSIDPRPGSTAVIRHGALGSFFMDIDGRSGFRAARRS